MAASFNEAPRRCPPGKSAVASLRIAVPDEPDGHFGNQIGSFLPDQIVIFNLGNRTSIKQDAIDVLT
jgi:hypothetical protein